jgi:hypothetical protein
MTATPVDQRSAVEGTDVRQTTFVNPLTGKRIVLDDPYRPIHAFDDAESNTRTYIHPRTRERFTSVTTVLSVIEKWGLAPWYAKHGVLDTIANLAEVNAAAGAGRVTCELGEFCGVCLTCLIARFRRAPERERDAAADRGIRFHHVAEIYALTGEIIPHDPDIAPHVINFLDFVRVHQVTFHAAEVTVLNRADGWGGTLDNVLECGWMPPKHRDLIGVPLMSDYKTGSIHVQAGLQLAAYRNAEVMLLDDGSEHEIPPAHPDVALSLQINAKGWWVRPCPTTEQAYDKFQRVLGLWRDLHEPDLDIVGRAMYKPRPRKTTTTTAE